MRGKEVNEHNYVRVSQTGVYFESATRKPNPGHQQELDGERRELGIVRRRSLQRRSARMFTGHDWCEAHRVKESETCGNDSHCHRQWQPSLLTRSSKLTPNTDPDRIQPDRDYARDGERETTGKQTQQETRAPRQEGDQPGDEAVAGRAKELRCPAQNPDVRHCAFFAPAVRTLAVPQSFALMPSKREGEFMPFK
ncbi:Hypothetical protein SMAX5B_019685 [Scophthalmus maximus]|uniref:Uncharacterized protein n=1 Tax=Scophthalmus maximus TaxID=52904 RepID=A0A2U9CVX1_SCOMX|nr:Hypothetical protein SMAX5B_019685 [Scophthalmus maximus]